MRRGEKWKEEDVKRRQRERETEKERERERERERVEGEKMDEMLRNIAPNNDFVTVFKCSKGDRKKRENYDGDGGKGGRRKVKG